MDLFDDWRTADILAFWEAFAFDQIVQTLPMVQAEPIDTRPDSFTQAIEGDDALLITPVQLARALASLSQDGERLDPQLIFDVITDGAGNSRIFELRAPMMVAGNYDDATMKIETWQKDLDVIGKFADESQCPIPLFDAASAPYRAAMDQGLAAKDTAAVCEVLENQVGFARKT